jgi:tetratricopeptide (TPR) repeat protein
VEASLLANFIDTSVVELESEGLEDLVIKFAEYLPRLLRSTGDNDFAVLLKVAKIVAISSNPRPAALCVKLLIDTAFALSPRGQLNEAIRLVERALDISQDQRLLPELRRCFSAYSLLSTEAGFPAKGIECAVRAAQIANELGDEMGVASAQVNLTAALHTMGLYRECIQVASSVIEAFGADSRCNQFVASARGNLAVSALALRDYTLGSISAKAACESLGLPRDSNGIFNRLVFESNWMKCAIGLEEKDVASARLKMVRSLAEAFKTPRTDLNRQLSEAAYEIFDGDLTIAVAKLLKHLDTSKALPTLYRDNLVLLVRAYEKAHDHTGVLI